MFLFIILFLLVRQSFSNWRENIKEMNDIIHHFRDLIYRSAGFDLFVMVPLTPQEMTVAKQHELDVILKSENWQWIIFAAEAVLIPSHLMSTFRNASL